MRACRASMKRWCAPASSRPGSITSVPTRCNSWGRASVSICVLSIEDGCPLSIARSNRTPVVSLRDVGKSFESGTVALAGFDFAVHDGEFVSLLGPSGCGKSTALRILAGLSQPTTGQVEWHDQQHHRIGFVFQEPTLMPWATVAGNVELPLKLQHADSKERRVAMARALQRVGLADFADAYPRELSGGMRMRV